VREVLIIKPNLGIVTVGHGEIIKIKEYKVCSTKYCKYFVYKFHTYQMHNVQLII